MDSQPMPMSCRDCGETLTSDSIFSPDTGRHLCGAGKKIVMQPYEPNSGPPCIWDNAPTRRAGSCYVCIMCGNSTSC